MEECGGTCLLFVISLLRHGAWGLNLPSGLVHVHRKLKLHFQVRKHTQLHGVPQVLVVISSAYGLISDTAGSVKTELFLFKLPVFHGSLISANTSLCHSPSSARVTTCVCLNSEGLSTLFTPRSLQELIEGSLPTPKQIMRVLIEQEKARGSWRGAWYLRFIFSLV